MKLVCELFRKMQNSTKIHGICVEQLLVAINNITLQNLTAPANLTERQSHSLPTHHIHNQDVVTNLKNVFHTNSHDSQAISDDHFGAGMFIIVVMCFYSMSILFLTLFNIRFKIVFSPGHGICGCRESEIDQNYESQKDETKNTIHMIFNDSSKLLPSVAISNSYILTAAFNEKLAQQLGETAKAAIDSQLSTTNKQPPEEKCLFTLV